MEKKNTLLLTVIAVATLLVAVVGATFAYFASTESPNAALTNVTATTEDATSLFEASRDKDIVITVTAAEMVQSKSLSQNHLAASDTANITVTYKAETSLSCKYDIIYSWVTGTGIDAYSPAATGEFTYAITTTNGANAVSTETVAATSFTGEETAKTKVVTDAVIQGSLTGAKGTTKTHRIDVNFYNLQDVAQVGGKTYQGKFEIDNVRCALTDN